VDSESAWRSESGVSYRGRIGLLLFVLNVLSIPRSPSNSQNIDDPDLCDNRRSGWASQFPIHSLSHGARPNPFSNRCSSGSMYSRNPNRDDLAFDIPGALGLGAQAARDVGRARVRLRRLSQGGVVETLLQAIRDQERRQHTLRAELANLDRPRIVLPMGVQRLSERSWWTLGLG
jgi:hypothetical protein